MKTAETPGRTTMERAGKRQAACVLLDELRINNREIEAGVVKGLTGAGYTVNVVPGIGLDVSGKPVPEGSIIAVYKMGGAKCTDHGK